MRILFIGCVKFSLQMLVCLLEMKESEIVGIVTRKNSGFNSDFFSLGSVADKYNIPCYYTDENNKKNMADWITLFKPDVIYCFGWSFILKKNVIDIPSIGTIGYHPAALPMNRGRHPIIWALALGLDKTASTFFFIDEGTDAGDILSQVFVPIDKYDDAFSLYNKLSSVALLQLNEFTKSLANNTYSRIPQDHTHSNYWRKRNYNDGEIDWRMPAGGIYNLVRALTRPYVGAHCIYKDKAVKVWKTEIVNADYKNFEPGKVVESYGTTFLIKCGEGVLRIVEHEFEVIPKVGEYL